MHIVTYHSCIIVQCDTTVWDERTIRGNAIEHTGQCAAVAGACCDDTCAAVAGACCAASFFSTREATELCARLFPIGDDMVDSSVSVVDVSCLKLPPSLGLFPMDVVASGSFVVRSNNGWISIRSSCEDIGEEMGLASESSKVPIVFVGVMKAGVGIGILRFVSSRVVSGMGGLFLAPEDDAVDEHRVMCLRSIIS